MADKLISPQTAKTRAQSLQQRRALKMAASAHAYVRGNTVQFYEWLNEHAGKAIPSGPDIWICGDCHIGNLGPVSDASGNVDVQIRDLDQTVIGNPAHDIIRLGLSLAMAARSSDLPGVTTARMLEAAMSGYRLALRQKPGASVVPKVIASTYKNALQRKWRHLARERLDGTAPSIPLGKNFWPLMKPEKTALDELFQQESLCALLTSLEQRDSDSDVQLLDAAYWVKGCSSLGGLRFVALAAIGEDTKNIAPRNLSLVDIKQASAAAAPRSATASMPRDNAERVVTGARHLSPHLGNRMPAARVLGKPVFVRELLPQDIKFDMHRLNIDEAIGAAQYLAQVLGRAHWRQMDAATRTSWASDLKRAHTRTMDAPSWLWSSVVDLIAKHEVAYLAHCRKYARGLRR
ncbi:DUF2252 domain-containing protein [Pseudolysobacter antarcticus]|uniref:DUF2252 domain-containing protein n=1 Tax=Pseudolysobacter antarcticus TaxID=2511995 RepID=A0A411HL41_9GAMM|nr:DUF2252 family protein [Pseudolysobacter antarcticus]QBB71211.1 DUF2252 domain-containing protein [Pseudolysobacter antarcticus]